MKIDKRLTSTQHPKSPISLRKRNLYSLWFRNAEGKPLVRMIYIGHDFGEALDSAQQVCKDFPKYTIDSISCTEQDIVLVYRGAY